MRSYGATYLYIGKDITDKREQTESLLRKSEKLAVVGHLAAGIAYEIRNPLTSIKGFIQLIHAETDQHKEFKEKGTGLGLMTCLKIIKNHKGDFKISSKVGKGTTIEVLLPAITPSRRKREKQMLWNLKEEGTLDSFS